MKAMLEELKKLDKDTWDYIDAVLKLGFPMSGICDPNGKIACSIIQGEIQRAIEAKGWDLQQSMRGMAQKSFKAIIEYWIALPMIIQQPKEYYRSYHRIEEGSDSPASALLACYLKAIRGCADDNAD